MPDDDKLTLDQQLSAEIVGAYLRNHRVPAEQLGALISTVHQVLAGLGKPAIEAVVERTPAVPIRRSVNRDYVVCLECGWRGLLLRRHVATSHGLSIDQYRARWNLPREHPITAPAHSERRSTMAKELGFGHGGRSSGKAPEPAAAPQPGRRGRARSAARST